MNFQGASTTTTTKVTETHVQTNIRWDPGYVKTIPGILKVAQIVSNRMLLINHHIIVSQIYCFTILAIFVKNALIAKSSKRLLDKQFLGKEFPFSSCFIFVLSSLMLL